MIAEILVMLKQVGWMLVVGYLIIVGTHPGFINGQTSTGGAIKVQQQVKKVLFIYAIYPTCCVCWVSKSDNLNK